MHFPDAALAETSETKFFLRPEVRPGDTVRLNSGTIVTITEDGHTCDCGNGVVCDKNEFVRTSDSDDD